MITDENYSNCVMEVMLGISSLHLEVEAKVLKLINRLLQGIEEDDVLSIHLRIHKRLNIYKYMFLSQKYEFLMEKH